MTRKFIGTRNATLTDVLWFFVGLPLWILHAAFENYAHDNDLTHFSCERMRDEDILEGRQ